MKTNRACGWFLALFLGNLFCGGTIRAQSTIDPSLAYGWAANVGWTNWRPSAASGAVIGEYVCAGYVYSANVGWINLGSGTPANGIQYGNTAAGDCGVNYFPTGSPGLGSLRGLAYLTVTFCSSAARLFRIETSCWLVNASWMDAVFGSFVPDSGASTTRQFAGGSNGTPQFFRVRAVRTGF